MSFLFLKKKKTTAVRVASVNAVGIVIEKERRQSGEMFSLYSLVSLKLNWAYVTVLEPQSVLEKCLVLFSIFGALNLVKLAFLLHKKLFKNYTWRLNRVTMLPFCLKSSTDNINQTIIFR